MIDLSLVVPTFNEAVSISRTAERILLALQAEQISCELILVNDGSTDDTEKMCRYLCNKYPNRVYLVNHRENCGMGAALRSGFLSSRGRYLTFLPADGQITPDHLMPLIQARAEDLFCYHLYSKRAPTLIERVKRTITTSGLNFWARLFLGLKDEYGGVYLFHRKWLLPDTIGKVYAQTFVFNLEVLEIMHRTIPRKRAFHIVPANRTEGKSKVFNIRKIWSVFWELFSIWQIRQCSDK